MWLRIFLAPMRTRKRDLAAGSTHRRKGQHDLLRYEDWYYYGAGRSGAILITETERALGLIGCDNVVFGLPPHHRTTRRHAGRTAPHREEAGHDSAQEAENHCNDDCKLAAAG